ncbi:hypothetical protein DFH06DRAFT_1024993 [Mycena polygramma]|nr:hypothetical protein DFH06DRAFT_1024993 [Mycena polygramma]
MRDTKLITRTIPGTQYKPDGWHCIIAGDEDSPWSLFEAKPEMGEGGGEPHWQGMRYYIELTKKQAGTYPRARLPQFLGIYWATLDISAAVWNGKKPVLQKLHPTLLAFDWHDTDIQAAGHAARVFCAYRSAFLKTGEYRSIPFDHLPDPQYPDVCSYTSLSDGSIQQFQYRSQVPDKLLFQAEGKDEQKLMVKFTQRYSQELHSFCAAAGFAPKLLGCEAIGAGWNIVVMQDLTSTHSIVSDADQVPTPAIHRFKDFVAAMHGNGFVHGDIRAPNLLMSDNAQGELLLIDFDWGGKDSVSKYPWNLHPILQNDPPLRRPHDAQGGGPITKEHDTEMLNMLFPNPN